MAPLEFVFVFPLLLCLTAGLFLIARADVTKSFTATDARHKAWQNRPRVPAGDPLVINADAAESLASRTTLKPVESGPVFPNGFRAESRNSVFANPWDYRDVPFAPGVPTLEPHLDELKMVAGQVPAIGPIIGFTLTATAYALAPDRNFALQAVAFTGRLMNPVIELAGWLLKYVASPAIRAAQIPIEIAMIPLRVASWFSRSARRLLRFLERVIDMMNVGLDAADNLYEASRGRPGRWNFNLVRRLMNFRF